LGSSNDKCITNSLFLHLKTYKHGKSEVTFVAMSYLHLLCCFCHLVHIYKLDVSNFSTGEFLLEWMEGSELLLYLCVLRVHLYHSIFHVSFQLLFVTFDG
jgi:hypothetical protein